MLLGLAHERVLLQRTGEELRLALRRGDGVQDIGQLPWTAQEAEHGDALLGSLLAPRVAELPRWLLLPACAVLLPRLSLPPAPAAPLRAVLASEIDRQTPFPPRP